MSNQASLAVAIILVMIRKKILNILKVVAIIACTFAGTGLVYAHTPICDCYDNGDNTVSCEGGFSDGASAAGITVHIVDTSGKVLIQGEMSEYSDYTFVRPDGDFYVRYLAGEGHTIEIDSRDIEE